MFQEAFEPAFLDNAAAHEIMTEYLRVLKIDDEDAKLKWFDLSEGYLYLDLIEKTDNKIQHKKFSLLIEPSLTERINKLFDGAEKAKKSYDSDLISVNSYIGEEEKFFYTAKATFKNSNNSKSVFNAVCE